MLDCLTSVCANFAARPVFHHGAPCVAAANGARRSLPMASRACVSPSASLRLPLPHGCQDIFTDTRSACLSGFQGSIPLRTQTARGGSLKACPERSRTDPQDLGMDRLAEAFPYGCATPIRHPQSSVALRFEAATHMPRYFHTHPDKCLCEFRGKARFPPRSALCGSGKRSKAEFADGFDGMRITIGKPALAAATRLPGYFHRHSLGVSVRISGQHSLADAAPPGVAASKLVLSEAERIRSGLGDGSPRRGLSVRMRHSHSPSPKLRCTTL